MKYRMKQLDPVNDIWLLQERFLLVFWISVSAGSKERVKQKMDELNSRRMKQQ